MVIPRHIEKRLKQFDRNLTAKWNPAKQRWQILRRNPIRPTEPPSVVCTWQRDSGAFLPLDERIFKFLRDADMRRKFAYRDVRHWGALLEAEIREKDAIQAKRREQVEAEEFNKLYDGLVFMAKNDRRRIKPETVKP